MTTNKEDGEMPYCIVFADLKGLRLNTDHLDEALGPILEAGQLVVYGLS